MTATLTRRAYGLVRRAGFLVEAERAHELAIRGLAAVEPALPMLVRPPRDRRLAQRRWGVDFPNPVGLAAGYDKRAAAIPAWRALGFGFVEVGTITPEAQPGNPRPRVFRIPEHEALVNRLGFNNDGADATMARIAAVRAAGSVGIPIGVNLGKGRDTPADEAAGDYRRAVAAAWPVADYLVVNVSSPNTPGLRDLQATGPLGRVIDAAAGANDEAAAVAGRSPRPLLVKLAPDLRDDQVDAIVDTCAARGVGGLILCNTTITRPSVDGARHAGERGGLSGRPLAGRSFALLTRVARRAPDVALVSVGGVFDADDAWERLAAGACLVQVWTALTYRGPTVVADINRGLLARMEREGVRDLSELIGSAR